MNFETIIGIEIHCELKTKTKMFSSAPNAFGEAPNTLVNPVDMAFPGTLPTLNKRAVEYGIMASTALNMKIDNELWFDRKNYFYPDLTKGYQITQDKRPIGSDGYIEIDVDGQKKKIRIERLHLEEDTAKQLHFNDYTLIDYNRCGVPLVEIVSKADMRSGKEAAAYVDKLRSILLYSGVSDVKMEEGSMRCDVNISLRPYGQKEFGVKTEIKNLNSVSNVLRAIDFEVERQTKLLLKGECVEQETRRFDETLKQTVLMRKKTDAVDYKYFTEANIVPVKLSDEFIKNAQSKLPELPDARLNRYLSLGLSDVDANILVQKKEIGDYFDEALKHYSEAKLISNWVLGEVLGYANKTNQSILEINVKPNLLVELIQMINSNAVSSKQGKTIFEEMCKSGKSPKTIAKEKGMEQITDPNVILAMVIEVLDANNDQVETYKQGRQNVLGFLVGQVIKKSRGQANPGLVNKILKEEIEKR